MALCMLLEISTFMEYNNNTSAGKQLIMMLSFEDIYTAPLVLPDLS